MTPAAIQDIYATGWLVIFLMIFTSLAFWLHTAHTKLELIVSYLPNCRAIQNRSPMLGAGPIGRLLMLGTVSGILAVPSVYLKDGGANEQDIHHFPGNLRRLILLQYGLVSLSAISMFLWWGWGQYMGLN